MAYPYYNVDGTKSIHAWQADREYAIGDVVRANPSKGNTLAFKCIELRAVAPGEKPKSDTEEFYATFPENEPSFPFKIATELQDNDITWLSFEPLAEELLRLAPTAIIDLFEIQLTEAVNGVNDILHYHAGKNGLTEDIKFGGQTYPAVPVEIDGFEFSAKGTLPRPTLRVANVNNAITSLMLLYNPLAAEVRRIRTFAKFIDTTNFNEDVGFTRESDVEDFLITQDGDTLIEETFNDTADPDAKIVETWYIDRVSSENPQFVEFELAPKLDLTNLALPRRTIEEFCPWTYRGGRECPYVGDDCFTIDDQRITGGTLEERKAADVCGKRLSSCQARFPDKDKLPFGGFYGARLQA
jgi:phage-related protein